MTRADALLILLLAALVGWTGMQQWAERGPATAVAIHRGGERIAMHPLDVDRELRIEGRIGTAHIHIRDGRARFHRSPCPRKVCMHMGWQAHGGAVAACVPNGLSIQLIGGEGGFDGIAG